MLHLNSVRFATLGTALCCLLAFAVFSAGSWQARAQSPSAAQANQSSGPSGSLVALAQHTPQKVLDGTAIRVSHYNPEQMLRLVLAVQDSHIAEEDQFIKELTTRGSPNFHKFLTQDEWNARFAPAAEDEQKVVDWAQSVGLTVTNRYPNRLLVDVEAPAGVIEKAFGVTINNYQVRDEVDFSNDRDPAIPANLSGILHAVAGLENIDRVRRLGTKYKTVKGADYAAGPVIAEGDHLMGVGDPAKASASGAPVPKESGSASGSTPEDSYSLDCIGSNCEMNPDNIWSSEGYNYNALQRFSHCCNVHNDSTGSPAVSSIALVGYGAFNYSDVTEFFNFYGLAWNISVWWVDGSSPAVDGEAPLDVEYAGAMSNNPGTPNNTAHIYEYEMADGSIGTYEDAFAQIVSQDHAKVVSTSYGGTEALSGPWNTAETGALHTTFNNMVAAGYTLIAASGDNGASDGCGDATDVDFPSSDPNFIAAGGTQLTLNGSGIYVSEIGWQGEFWTNEDGTGPFGACANNHGGSTGGVSALFASPWWQNSSGTTIDVVSPYYAYQTISGTTTEWVFTGNTNRVLPDMALTANPDVVGEWYYSTCCDGGGWQDEGGTSIVAPELAGFFAQENTYLNYIGNICGSGTDACTPVGLASPFLYENGANNTQHQPFYDMLSGCSDNNNTVQNDLFYYCAAPGFDLVTGWGSANMMQLAWGINWQLIPAYSQPSVSFTSGPATGAWYNSDQAVYWTVTDGLSQGTGTPSGVAGFTQGWDSIPSDPYSEPHSGEGNSFYSGPQYAFGTTGCLSLDGGFGCSGNGGHQGCHTVQVEGWDNQGVTAYGSYGPICYDTVAPTITASTSPTSSYYTWVNKPVVITLHPNDPGGSNASGIDWSAYDVDNPESNCYPGVYGTGCYLYTGPITVSTQGHHYIYYFTLDNAGNFSTEPYIWVSIDLSTPVTTASLSGTLYSGSIFESAVGITLNATDSGGSGIDFTYYSLDGGAITKYSGALTVTALGSHTIKYWSVNNADTTEPVVTTTFSIASPTTAALVATPDPSLLGQSVKMTATVIATLSGTPTGTVQFWNGATSLGTATLSGGVATLSTTALPAGALLTLQASFLGSADYLATNSPPFDQTVNENTTTKVTITPNPVVYGQDNTLTATVSPSSSGTPTGTVAFYLGGNYIGTLSLSGGVATISTGYFSSLGSGTYSITGVYSGDSTYLTSTSAAVSETVDKASQTITFAALPAMTWGAAPFNVSATASSGMTVGFASTTPLVCTVSGTTVTLVTAGTCGIQATQTGNSDYSAAPAVTRSFTVNHEPQTITFAALPAVTFGIAPFTVSATASSGLTVSFTSPTPSVCTVAGTTVTLVAAGTCEIVASQAGNSNYLATPSVNQYFTVHHGVQTITFPTIPATTLLTGSVTLSATASSGLPVSFASTTPLVCTVSGTTATLVTTGSCTIDASQAGNSGWDAATTVKQTFAVTLAPQAITFATLPAQTWGAAPFTVSATASSGLTVGFASTTPLVCTVSGTTVTLVIAGTCSIKATQAGNTDYAAAPAVTQSFTVSHEPQTITFTAIPATTLLTGSVTLSATASSGLAVSFASTTPLVCTVSGTTATLVTTGNCTIAASQAGNSDWATATVNQTFAVTLTPQTITFPTIPAMTYGAAPFTVSATASSGLAVSITGPTPLVCTVSGTTVTLVAAGTCEIVASQAGNIDYAAASVAQYFTVHHEGQTITFPTIPSTSLSAGTISLSATASSGLTVSFASTTPLVCTVSGTTATLVTAGSCTITASQAGNGGWSPATKTQTFTVTAD